MWPRSLQEAALVPRTPQPPGAPRQGCPRQQSSHSAGLSHPGAVYREMLPGKVWAEDPTGVKDKEAAGLLLLRDTLEHRSQRKLSPGTSRLLISPWAGTLKPKKLYLVPPQVTTVVPTHWEFSMGKKGSQVPSPGAEPQAPVSLCSQTSGARPALGSEAGAQTATMSRMCLCLGAAALLWKQEN